MYKALAVVRTVAFIFLVGYTIRAYPFITTFAGTFDEQYAKCTAALNLLGRAAWLSMGWIAFEVVVGWLLASRARKVAAEPPSAAPSVPAA
jgi:hypothetical protein